MRCVGALSFLGGKSEESEVSEVSGRVGDQRNQRYQRSRGEWGIRGIRDIRDIRGLGDGWEEFDFSDSYEGSDSLVLSVVRKICEISFRI